MYICQVLKWRPQRGRSQAQQGSGTERSSAAQPAMAGHQPAPDRRLGARRGSLPMRPAPFLRPGRRPEEEPRLGRGGVTGGGEGGDTDSHQSRGGTGVSPGQYRALREPPRRPLRGAALRAAAVPELSPSSETDELSVSSSSELLPSFSP